MSGKIQRERLEFLDGDEVKRPDVGSRQVELAGHSRLQRSGIRARAHTPAVAILKAGKTKLRMGCDEVIAVRLQPLQKLISHFGAHRMRPTVGLIRIAAAVSEPAGEGLLRARVQRLAKDILLNRAIGFGHTTHSHYLNSGKSVFSMLSEETFNAYFASGADSGLHQ